MLSINSTSGAEQGESRRAVATKEETFNSETQTPVFCTGAIRMPNGIASPDGGEKVSWEKDMVWISRIHIYDNNKEYMWLEVRRNRGSKDQLDYL